MATFRGRRSALPHVALRGSRASGSRASRADSTIAHTLAPGHNARPRHGSRVTRCPFHPAHAARSRAIDDAAALEAPGPEPAAPSDRRVRGRSHRGRKTLAFSQMQGVRATMAAPPSTPAGRLCVSQRSSLAGSLARVFRSFLDSSHGGNPLEKIWFSGEFAVFMYRPTP